MILFANPKMLWMLLFTLPLLVWFLSWAWWKRQRLIAQFVRSRLLAQLTVGVSPVRQKLRLAVLAMAVGFVILALARPQWGFVWEEARQRGLDIVVAIDTSRSMLAEDIAPNRLNRAKLAALDLLRHAKNDRLGLVAFAGTAFLQCPLTLDDDAFRQSVDAVDVGVIPQGGTALTEAIKTALAAFKERENFKVLVLFTDGEDHEGGAVAAAEEAAKAGLRIFTVGVGTAAGELLRHRDESGNLAYIKDEAGNVVKSHLNETLLSQIAKAAHGFYMHLSGADTMDVLYDRGLAPLPKGEVSAKLIRHYQERFQIPLALALSLLILEMFWPERKRVTQSEGIAAASNLELRKAVGLLLFLPFTLNLGASPASALRSFEAGRYDQAKQEYDRLSEKNPKDTRLRYNAGAAAYRAKEYDAAGKEFEAALVSPDLKLQEHAYYNLGNTSYRLGERITEPSKKVETWEQSVQRFESALQLDPGDTDAKYNLELVRKKLEELKKQQSESAKQPSDGQDQKQQDQKKEDQKPQKQEGKQSDNESKAPSSKPQSPPPTPDKSAKQKEKQAEAEQNKDSKPHEAGQKETQTPGTGQNKDTKGESKETEAATVSGRTGQMTPQEARQLLEALKDEEKALIFTRPPPAQAPGRTFKDW